MATPQSLFKELSNGKFKPAYYFFGSEDYRISEAVKYISQQFLPDSQTSVNYIKLNGKKTKAGDLITSLSNLPMLGDKQVFAISDFQSYKPTEIKNILSFLTPPDPNRIIVFYSPSSKTPKKTSAFYKSISAVAQAVEFNRLNAQESRSQINHKLNKNEMTIMPEALNLLVELISGNRGALESEINKLIDYKSPGETINAIDVRKICHGYEAYSLFELSDLIITGNTAKVFKMIHALLAEGKSAVFLTSLLQSHFSSLYLVKNNKKPLGNRSFLIYKFRQQSAKYSNQRLEQIIIDIAQTDARLRQMGMPPKTTFESLVMTLCRDNL